MGKLAQLKKNRGANLKKLQSKLEEQNMGGAPRDERIWKPKFNKEKGKGTCIVRFLPTENDSFVEMQSYSFNGPGGNFFGPARRTLGLEDPVQLAAIDCFRKAKATDDKRFKEEGKKYLPKSQFYANVYVVKDEEVPENEGKVFIFQFGRQIFQKVEEKIKPQFEDEKAIDPFDLWDGADFIIRMVGRDIPDSRTGEKITVPNYEKSSFDNPSEFLDGDEDAIEKVIDQTYELDEFIDPGKFKSFEEDAARFKKVTGKPYDWLTADTTEHAEEMSTAEDLKNQTEDAPEPEGGDSSKDDGDDMSFTPDDADEDDDEDPVAKFRRMASQD